MSQLRRQLRRRTSDEGAVTLVELLVVVTLLGVIGGVATAGIVTTLNSARVTQARVDAIQELEIGGQRIARELRAAQSLVLAAGTDAGLDPTPFERQLGARVLRDADDYGVIFDIVEGDGPDDPARLVSRTFPDPDNPPDPDDPDTTDITLVTLVNLDTDEPIFRYLDSRGQELQCVWDSCAATYAQAARIEILLRRDIGADHPPVTVRTEVAVRNVRYPAVDGS